MFDPKEATKEELVRIIEGMQEAVRDPDIDFDPETGITDGPGWMEYPDGRFVVLVLNGPDVEYPHSRVKVTAEVEFWAAAK